MKKGDVVEIFIDPMTRDGGIGQSDQEVQWL